MSYLNQLKEMDYESKHGLSDNYLAGPLSRQEKIDIICSVLTSSGNNPIFDEETISSRIKQCFKIAEQFL